MTSSDDVVIVVGAGLAGLTAARQLQAAGVAAEVVEARSRVGGRLMTVDSGQPPGGRCDLGATWHWPGQGAVEALGRELGLTTMDQYDQGAVLTHVPGQAPRRLDQPLEPARRFVEGCQPLADGLAGSLADDTLSLDTRVTAITATDRALEVATSGPDGDGLRRASHVVLALPPRLVGQAMALDPALPAEVAQVVAATPTWMAAASKCVVLYEEAFWRGAGLSGSVLSPSGALYEIHDACGPEGRPAALWGFVSGVHAVRDLDPRERVDVVLAQLVEVFGPRAAEPVNYFERDWSRDPNTTEPVPEFGSDPLPYGHPIFDRPLMDGRLVWAGTETVAEGGGHMEGAIASGRRAAAKVLAGMGQP